MNAYNFSKLSKRESKLYSFGDVKISSTGVPTRFIAILAVLVIVSCVFHVAFATLIGVPYWVPIQENGNINIMGILVVIGIPVGLASALYYTKVSQYRLIELIYLYLKPKHPISTSGKRILHEKYTFNAFLEKQNTKHRGRR